MIAYDNFIKIISGFAKEIKSHSIRSWNGIDLKLTEPEIIKKYLLDNTVGVDYLNQNISKLINTNTQYQIKFASVFTHQKPRIQRTPNSIINCKGDTSQCELGDLLIIFCFVDKNKRVKVARGHIMQAKKKYELKSKSQKCFYDSDIEFLMPQTISSKSINTKQERVWPTFAENRVHALSYLILNEEAKYTSIRQIPWESEMEYGYENFLYRLIIGDIGKAFFPPSNVSNDWNCIIDDLVNVGTGKVSSSIGRGEGLKFVLDVFNFYFILTEYKLELENPGLPTLFIIVQDTELDE